MKGPGIKPVCGHVCVRGLCSAGQQQLLCGVSQKGCLGCWDPGPDAAFQQGSGCEMVPFRSEEAMNLRDAAHLKPSSSNAVFLCPTPFLSCPCQEVCFFPQPKSVSHRVSPCRYRLLWPWYQLVHLDIPLFPRRILIPSSLTTPFLPRKANWECKNR